MSADARFCGGCGATASAPTPAAPSIGDPADPSARELGEQLAALSRALVEVGTPAFLTDALDTLAVGPNASGHITAVVGEKGRGKTTLINRLLGAEVLPTGRQGYASSLTIRAAEAWGTLDAEGVATASTLPIPSGLGIQGVEGPASVLTSTTLLDTPGLNELDVAFEERVVAELVHADVFLICVAANQLLSQNERDLIRDRLLPLLGGEGALVVTHTDSLETDEDRADIERRVRRFARERLEVLFLPADREASPADVLAFIDDSARRHAANRAKAWRSKTAALLRGIEQAITDTPEDDAPPPVTRSREERLRELEALLDSEHSLALGDAESTLRERLSSIRLGLAERFRRWTAEYAQHEGVNEIVAEVKTVLREAAHLYVSSLERSLTSSVPRSIQVAAEGVGTSASSLADTAAAVDGPGAVEVVRRRDLRVPVLAVAGVGLLFVAAPVAPIAALASLWASSRLQKRLDVDRERQIREDAVSATSQWITSIEPELLEQLREAVRPVLNGVKARVEAIVDSTPTQPRTSPRRDVLARLETCFALAEGEPSSSQRTEVSS